MYSVLSLSVWLMYSALGKICLLEIDLVGVSIVRGRGFPEAKFVFIEPPSFPELERRLRERNTETPESVSQTIINPNKP